MRLHHSVHVGPSRGHPPGHLRRHLLRNYFTDGGGGIIYRRNFTSTVTKPVRRVSSWDKQWAIVARRMASDHWRTSSPPGIEPPVNQLWRALPPPNPPWVFQPRHTPPQSTRCGNHVWLCLPIPSESARGAALVASVIPTHTGFLWRRGIALVETIHSCQGVALPRQTILG